MKKTIGIIGAAVIALTLFIAPSASSAEDFLVAHVDLQWALNMSEKGKAAKKELEEEQERLKKELEEEQEELKALRDEIESKRDIWNEETVEKKEAEFLTRGRKFQEKVTRVDKEFTARKQQREQDIIQGLQEVVTEIAEKEGYHYVFESSLGAIVYARDDIDITEKVVEAYDKK